MGNYWNCSCEEQIRSLKRRKTGMEKFCEFSMMLAITSLLGLSRCMEARDDARLKRRRDALNPGGGGQGTVEGTDRRGWICGRQ